MEKNLINKYNNPNSILVISPYPEKGARYGSKVCAVAGFTKNTIDSLSEHYKESGTKTQFVILTIKVDDKAQLYEENGMLVWRIFEKNSPLSYLNLIKTVLKFNNINDILIGFEFASYGNSLTTAFFPLVQMILRLLRKRTTVVLHQVVDDFSLLAGHLGWKKSSVKIAIYNIILRVFLSLLAFSANNIVVLEGMIKNRLVKMIGFEEKINVIPHGIDKQMVITSKKSAREQLNIKNNEFILLYFGYLTWYKGVDFLIKALSLQKEIRGKKIRLIVAGGDSVTLKEKPHYRKFVDLVYSLAKRASHINITGFIPEAKIAKYFSAADLVVLPYRTMMSSSGPLSLAASFNKPFLLSSPLKGYFESVDFYESLKEAKLVRNDLLFALDKNKLVAKIESVMNLKKLTSLSRFASLLAQKRDFRALAPKYAQVIDHNHKELLSLNPAKAFLDQGFAHDNVVSLTQ